MSESANLASEQANPDSEVSKNWTIKDFPPALRAEVIRAVRQEAGMTAAKWLERACRRELARTEIIPPGQPSGPTLPENGPTSRPVDMSALADLLRAAAEASNAGLKGVAREVAGLVREHTREARGLTPLKGPTKPKNGPTKRLSGPTGP